MLILVAGLPGSGKSYFAENLADRLKYVYINSDETRTAMHTRGRYSDEDKLAVYKEMLSKAKKSVGDRRDVIVDATFYRDTVREMFRRLAKKNNTVLRIIEVVADEDLIRRRLQKTRVYSEADFAVYEKVRDDFEEITAPHLTLQSTNDNLESMTERAINYLKSEGD